MLLSYPIPIKNNYHLESASLNPFYQDRLKEIELERKLKGIGSGVQNFKNVIEEIEKVADEIENDYMKISSKYDFFYFYYDWCI